MVNFIFNLKLLILSLLKMQPSSIIYLFLMIFAVIFEILADYLFKEWVSKNKTLVLWIGMVVYAIGTVLWAFSLKYETLSRAGIFFNILYLILLVIVGVIAYNEKFTWREITALILCIIAIIILETK
jgi:drug/metabolite transporter (DMT)-like permease